MERQNTQNNYTILKENKVGGRTVPDLLENYSNQDNVLLAEGLTDGSKEQNRDLQQGGFQS